MLLQVCFRKRVIYTSDCSKFLRAALTGGSNGDQFFLEVVTELKKLEEMLKEDILLLEVVTLFKQHIC
jgi:hypothetical protein